MKVTKIGPSFGSLRARLWGMIGSMLPSCSACRGHNGIPLKLRSNTGQPKTPRFPSSRRAASNLQFLLDSSETRRSFLKHFFAATTCTLLVVVCVQSLPGNRTCIFCFWSRSKQSRRLTRYAMSLVPTLFGLRIFRIPTPNLFSAFRHVLDGASRSWWGAEKSCRHASNLKC